MVDKKSEKELNEEKALKILDKSKKSEKKRKTDLIKNKEEIEREFRKKPKLGISIKVHKNLSAKQQLAEKGIKINPLKILDSIFSRKNIIKGTGKVLKTANKMLKEDVNDYSEHEINEKDGLKVEHGFRMRFLDSDKDNSHFKWVKKKDKKKNENN